MEDVLNNQITLRQRMAIRIGRGSLSFAVKDATADGQVAYEPFTAKSGMSMAANMREAFRDSDLLSRGYQRAQVLIDADVLMIPVEEYEPETKEELYRQAFTNAEGDVVMQSIVPNLNAVAVFGINKDLKMVVEDHFSDVRYMPVAQPIWSYMHSRSFSGANRKMYGYFHDGRLGIFSFDKNRFKFCNSYDVKKGNDAAYFLLYVWKELNLDAEKDELCLSGEAPEKDKLQEIVRRYVRRAYFINPAGEFNRAPITQIKGMPMDLITYFVKGR